MKAILITTMWVEVENADEAAELVIDIDKMGRLNAESILERRGKGWSDLDGICGLLGTSFWLIEEAVA